MADLQALADALIRGDRDTTAQLTQAALDEGSNPKEILDNGLVAGMNVVGERFKANEFYVPEVLIAARAMHAALDVLRPKLAEAGVEPIATVVIGTVKGDLHDIGKNLVAMMLTGAGLKVVDAKTDVSPEHELEGADRRVEIGLPWNETSARRGDRHRRQRVRSDDDEQGRGDEQIARDEPERKPEPEHHSGPRRHARKQGVGPNVSRARRRADVDLSGLEHVAGLEVERAR